MKTNYSREELADLLAVKPATLAAWAADRRGPVFFKRRGRAIYRAVEIAAWLDDPAAYDATRRSTTTSPSPRRLR